jgi:hypothetical protein
MSDAQPGQTGTPQTPQQPLPQGAGPSDSQSHEPALVKLYCELTGENEAQARSAVSFVIERKEDSSTNP